MMAVDKQGRVYMGVDSWARIGRTLPGWNLVSWILRVPGIHLFATWIYAWVARNRYRWNRAECAHSSCSIHFPMK